MYYLNLLFIVLLIYYAYKINDSYLKLEHGAIIGFKVKTESYDHLQGNTNVRDSNVVAEFTKRVKQLNPSSIEDFFFNENIQDLLKLNNIEINHVENLKVNESFLVPFASKDVLFKNCEINNDILFEGKNLIFEGCKFEDNISIYSEDKDCELNIVNCSLPQRINSDDIKNDVIKARERSLKIRGKYSEVVIEAKKEENKYIGGLIDTSLAIIEKENKPNQIKFFKIDTINNSKSSGSMEMESSLILKLFKWSIIKTKNFPRKLLLDQLKIVKKENDISSNNEALEKCKVSKEEQIYRANEQEKSLKILQKPITKTYIELPYFSE